jgi:hypothetical protein
MSSLDNKSVSGNTGEAFGATPLAGIPAATFDFIIALLEKSCLGCTGDGAGAAAVGGKDGIVTVAFITGGETVGVALLAGLNFPALRSAKRCS